MRPIRLPPYHR